MTLVINMKVVLHELIKSLHLKYNPHDDTPSPIMDQSTEVLKMIPLERMELKCVMRVNPV